MTRQTSELGRFGEAFAASYVERTLGWVILERNWNSRVGEIDLIANDRDRVVFMEVRCRRQNGRTGTAVESVSPAKFRRLWRTAELYSVTRHFAFQPQFEFHLLALGYKETQIVEFQHLRTLDEESV